MPILSRLRSRRYLAEQKSTQQLVIFRLRQEWFALPLNVIEKVVILDRIYGDPNQTGVSLTLYNNREIVVVDVGHRIFNGATDLSDQNNYTLMTQRYLIIVSTNSELIGLPVDSPPTIRRVTQSAFIPLPQAYVAQGNIRCVSSTAIQLADEPPIFILDHQLLSQPGTIVSTLDQSLDFQDKNNSDEILC